jgi:hypothetical protein
MKLLFAAITACALINEVNAYDRNRSLWEEWQRQREPAEMQKIEEAARRRESEHNNRMQHLERQQKIQQEEEERRNRKLEAEQYRLWLWTR